MTAQFPTLQKNHLPTCGDIIQPPSAEDTPGQSKAPGPSLPAKPPKPRPSVYTYFMPKKPKVHKVKPVIMKDVSSDSEDTLNQSDVEENRKTPSSVEPQPEVTSSANTDPTIKEVERTNSEVEHTSEISTDELQQENTQPAVTGLEAFLVCTTKNKPEVLDPSQLHNLTTNSASGSEQEKECSPLSRGVKRKYIPDQDDTLPKTKYLRRNSTMKDVHGETNNRNVESGKATVSYETTKPNQDDDSARSDYEEKPAAMLEKTPSSALNRSKKHKISSSRPKPSEQHKVLSTVSKPSAKNHKVLQEVELSDQKLPNEDAIPEKETSDETKSSDSKKTCALEQVRAVICDGKTIGARKTNGTAIVDNGETTIRAQNTTRADSENVNVSTKENTHAVKNFKRSRDQSLVPDEEEECLPKRRAVREQVAKGSEASDPVGVCVKGHKVVGGLKKVKSPVASNRLTGVTSQQITSEVNSKTIRYITTIQYLGS